MRSSEARILPALFALVFAVVSGPDVAFAATPPALAWSTVVQASADDTADAEEAPADPGNEVDPDHGDGEGEDPSEDGGGQEPGPDGGEGDGEGDEMEDPEQDGGAPSTSEPAELDPVSTAIAVVGFVALVAVAAWWMVRRRDPDAQAYPREPDSDWPDSSIL